MSPSPIRFDIHRPKRTSQLSSAARPCKRTRACAVISSSCGVGEGHQQRRNQALTGKIKANKQASRRRLVDCKMEGRGQTQLT